MQTNRKISLVVPVYNSRECVQPLVHRVQECLEGLEYELILINDCSPDETWEEIKKAVKSNNRVIGINLRKNYGQDNAIMAGFSRVSGDYVVIMDDDLQHDPGDINKLVLELEKGDFDVCFANFKTRKHRKWKILEVGSMEKWQK